ncbi:MAG TPA: CHAD domain-containing protein [Thermoanaerobaculia bacterium]|nr:CHAD domain-containing protein [Thermoanaerobaculia bacterium]
MALRIDEHESLGAGLPRVLAERLDAAIAHLTESHDESRSHEARKRLKETRAVLRLVRGEIGEETFAIENTALRDAGRRLSDVRDAEALLEALAKLDLGSLSVLAQRRVRRALTARLDRLAKAASNEQLTPVVDILRASRDRIAVWIFPDRGFEIVEDGLAATYARGRRLFRRVEREHEPSVLHEWRKRVKDAWYHHQLLERAFPAVVKGYAHALKELSDLLGDHHDLDVLRALLIAEPATFGKQPDVEALLAIVDRRRAELEHDALALGARLFHERRRAVAERWRFWWDGR